MDALIVQSRLLVILPFRIYLPRVSLLLILEIALVTSKLKYRRKPKFKIVRIFSRQLRELRVQSHRDKRSMQQDPSNLDMLIQAEQTSSRVADRTQSLVPVIGAKTR